MKGLSKNVKHHEILLFDYSVRQKIEDPGSISTQNIFPLTPVVPKPPQLPYGAKYVCLAENPVFQFFPPLVPYRLRWPGPPATWTGLCRINS